MLGEGFQENPVRELGISRRDGKKPSRTVISGEVPGSARSLIPWGALEHEPHLRICPPGGKRAGHLCFRRPVGGYGDPDGRARGAGIGRASAEHRGLEGRSKMWFKDHVWLRRSGSAPTVSAFRGMEGGPSSKRTN